MPFIKGKFKTYKAFAAANLSGIYTDEKLKGSLRVAATELASGLLINDKGTLRWAQLPDAVQISPGYGAAAADFTGGGKPSLAISQNLFTREPETGLWRGGLGCLLSPSGKEAGSFPPWEPSRSGLMIPGDGKALAIIDLDGDNRPDLLASQNDDKLLAFQNTSTSGTPLAVRLTGLPGNLHALGARIRLIAGKTVLSAAEITGGSGYLSQNSATVFFSRPASRALGLRIRWPDGSESTATVPADVKWMNVPFSGEKPVK
jgi:hypothetical protein